MLDLIAVFCLYSFYVFSWIITIIGSVLYCILIPISIFAPIYFIYGIWSFFYDF